MYTLRLMLFIHGNYGTLRPQDIIKSESKRVKKLLAPARTKTKELPRG